MSCNCNDSLTFEKMLSKAKSEEINSGVEQGVYIKIVDDKDYFFIRPVTEITYEITPEYFDVLGNKVEVKKEKKAKPKTKEDALSELPGTTNS